MAAEVALDCTAEGWWKENAASYPRLARLARLYLTHSASSVAVESMFSTMGLLRNGRRVSLAPHTANDVLFVHDNFRLYF
jgi:hypothetical protein